MTTGLSATGLVLAIANTAVYPPRAAAAEPVSMSSAYSRPGSRRWVCRSTKPGSSTCPVASITTAAVESSGIREPGTDVGDLAVVDQHVDAVALAIERTPRSSTLMPQPLSPLDRLCTDQQMEQHRHPHVDTVGNLLQHSRLR